MQQQKEMVYAKLGTTQKPYWLQPFIIENKTK
jgi:hypothetical protein